jgi:hypothetical protein
LIIYPSKASRESNDNLLDLLVINVTQNTEKRKTYGKFKAQQAIQSDFMKTPIYWESAIHCKRLTSVPSFKIWWAYFYFG